MTLVRWKPQRNLHSMQKNWHSMMNDFFNSNYDDEFINTVWVPRVDITENESGYQVHADLPGMSREDVQITLDDGVLTINGERKSSFEDKSESCHLSERVHGKFSRSFTLRNTIDTGKIDAEFNNGVLTVSLPKMEEAKPRKIEIKAH